MKICKEGHTDIGKYGCNVCRRAARTKYRETHRSKINDKQRVFITGKYGITQEDFDRMLVEQNGVCQICKGPQATGLSFNIDHCHTTGKVRGLLCSNCNRALGFFKDSRHILLSAVEYLNGSK